MLLRSPRVRVAGGDLCRLRSAEALTEPAGERGFAPATAVAAPAGPPFEKGTLHPAPTFDHLILPSDNVFGLDRIHFSLGEVREQFGANDVLLGVPGVLFQPILHIGCVGVDKALKGHIQIGFYLVKLFPLPSKRLSFRRKATLC